MVKKIPFTSFLLLLITLVTSNKTISQHALSIGPMFHVNIGGGKATTGYGFEVAYWNYEEFPYSVDLGFEYEKKKFRLYAEAQTGIAFTGVSAGPFLEFSAQQPIQAGLQGSFWINYFLGVDCRFRIKKGQDYIAPGLYAKLPFAVGPRDTDDSSDSHDFDWD